MLPADAIGMLNVTYEIDTSGDHGPARDIEIFDPERDHEAGRGLLLALLRHADSHRGCLFIGVDRK